MIRQMAAVAGSTYVPLANASIEDPIGAIPAEPVPSSVVRSELQPLDTVQSSFPAVVSPGEKSRGVAAKLARRDKLILEHLPLVRVIAFRVHGSLPVHLELDDLVHAGILGLLDAATKFDAGKHVTFPSYAKHRIKGAILDSLRQLDWASRDMRRRHKQVEVATLELASVLERAPSEHELATKLGMDVDRLRHLMIDLRTVSLPSSCARTTEEGDVPAPDYPSKTETQPDSLCVRSQMRDVLNGAIRTLPERHQKVVTFYYTNEMTMKEIGGILGINESRVSQIHKATLKKMASVLEADGITSSQAF